MAGDPSNASLWADADVWVASSLSTVNPADAEAEFGTGWELVGLLDGEEGFTESREESQTDFFAWGGIVVRTSQSNFKLTRSFTALEDNAAVRSLIYPGSTATEIVVPKYPLIKVAFETREGDEVKRLITRSSAKVTNVDDITESESELTKYAVTLTIYPDGDGVLFDRQTGTVTPE